MPKIVDHEEQRARLLDACFQVFAEDGYHGVSMRRLATSLGVSTGTLYHYFPNKQSIFEQLFGRVTRSDRQTAFDGLRPDAVFGTRLKAVQAFVDEQKGRLQDLLRLALEIYRHEPSSASREAVQKALDRYRQELEKGLGLGHNTLAGRVLFSFLLGSLVYDLLAPEQAQYDEQIALLELLGAELRGRSGVVAAEDDAAIEDSAEGDLEGSSEE